MEINRGGHSKAKVRLPAKVRPKLGRSRLTKDRACQADTHEIHSNLAQKATFAAKSPNQMVKFEKIPNTEFYQAKARPTKPKLYKKSK